MLPEKEPHDPGCGFRDHRRRHCRRVDGLPPAPHGRVVLLERESQPGYHSTGRSAALFLESYGSPQVRALTRASRAFLRHAARRLRHPVLAAARRALLVAAPGQEAELEAHWDLLRAMTPHARRLTRPRRCSSCRCCVPSGDRRRAEPDAMDMDVHAIHQGYLRGCAARAAAVVCDAEVTALARVGAAGSRLPRGRLARAGGDQRRGRLVRRGRRSPASRHRAAAQAPSAFTFAPPPGLGRAPLALPGRRRRKLVRQAGRRHAAGLARQRRSGAAAGRAAGGAGHRAGHRPHRADDDAQIRRPARTWAGLRSFVADGDLVGGFDPARPASSGSPRRAATASRPRRRWAKPAPRSRAACRCRSASRSSA